MIDPYLKPDLIDRVKGSPHPFVGGGLHIGTVLSVKANKAFVDLGGKKLTISMDVLGVTPALGIKPKDTVVCGFLNNDNQELVLIGRINVRPDVYPTLAQFDALVTLVNQIEDRVSDLEA